MLSVLKVIHVLLLLCYTVSCWNLRDITNTPTRKCSTTAYYYFTDVGDFCQCKLKLV